MLDLIALVFKTIGQTATMPEPVKTLMLRLEVPFSIIALKHKLFLFDAEHPPRGLLNQLYQAGQLLNLDDYSDRLVCEQLERVVTTLNEKQSFELKSIKKLLKGFSVYTRKRNSNAQVLADRSLELAQNNEQIELASDSVENAIADSLQGVDVPENISTFIDQVWREVLALAYSNIKEKPESWNKAIKTMNDLVQSVMPPENEAQRKQLLAMLPGLLASLKSSLIKISYSKPDQSRFFKALAVCHVILMNKNVIKTSQQSAVGVSEDDNAVSPPSRYRTQAIATQFEQWYVFEQGSQPKWGRLIWKSMKTEKMLFVGKNGSKVAEISIQELAELYSQNKIRKVQFANKEIVKRVFNQVFGN